MSFELRGLCPLLQVFDMSASLAFYRDVLGFSIVDAAPSREHPETADWIWLRHDDVELMLNTAYDPDAVKPDAPPAERVTAHDDTILFIGAPDVDAAYEHLCSRGVDVRPPKVTRYGMKQLYLKDPDGFGICFQWRA